MGGRCLLLACRAALWLACRPLPRGVRGDHYREWSAELPWIVSDTSLSRRRRALQAMAFSADQARTGIAYRISPQTSQQVLALLAVTILATVTVINHLNAQDPTSPLPPTAPSALSLQLNQQKTLIDQFNNELEALTTEHHKIDAKAACEAAGTKRDGPECVGTSGLAGKGAFYRHDVEQSTQVQKQIFAVAKDRSTAKKRQHELEKRLCEEEHTGC